MLIEPQRTDYDLNWRMFGVPIRVHPFFWLLVLLLGWPQVDLGFEFLLLWVVCVFVSILVHEFGHALTMRFFGMRSSIVLYSFGGLAIPHGYYRSRFEHIVVSLAGPIAGFILLGIVIGLDKAFHWAEQNPLTAATYLYLYFINLVWGLLNLLPIFPLDGGQVSRQIATAISPINGERFCYALSCGLAVVFAIHGLMARFGQPLIPWIPYGGIFMAFMFGLLAYESYLLFQHATRQRSFWDRDRLPWE